MEARNHALMKTFSDAQFQVYKKTIENPEFYKSLMKKFILQGLIKLFERRVKVICLEKDVHLIEAISKDCIREFKELVKKEMN